LWHKAFPHFRLPDREPDFPPFPAKFARILPENLISPIGAFPNAPGET
jgi:hypothetical protein